LFEKELGRCAESAAFVWTMTGDNDNAILEIGRNLIGSLDSVENHCHASERRNGQISGLQSRLNAS
jgi:hypothetical protein